MLGLRPSSGFTCTLGLLLVASACGSDDAPRGEHLPGYLATDACHELTDEASCGAAGDCEWIAIDATCPEGTDCPDGLCVTPDPCRAHTDAAGCVADTDNGCAWAETDFLCPPDADCADGFCYSAGGDDCACVCPAYCPAGEDCPPCDCDCSGGGGGGGGTCTCACPDCAPGETCPPCDCECTDDGCVADGTCTCACPDCAPGETCPPCDCSCEGPSGGPIETEPGCACPDCPPDATCPECDCPTDGDPCLEHADQDSCLEDVENSCEWLAYGMPCSPDMPECPSGVCQNLGGDDCACVCPGCAPGEDCPPCACDCSGGGGDSCVPGGTGSGGGSGGSDGGGGGGGETDPGY